MKFASVIASAVFLVETWPTRATATATAKEVTTFVPTRISYQDLQNLALDENQDDDSDNDNVRRLTTSLRSVLQEVGLFSITDIPLFGKEKPETLRHLPACVNALLVQSDEFPGSAARHVFPDGTLRKTIATAGDQRSLLPLFDNNDASSIPEPCVPLMQVSGAFRDTVAEVTRTVGHVLSRLGNQDQPPPLMWNRAQDTSYNLAQVVTHGVHLEHFHVYEKPAQNDNNDNDDQVTLDWHTDQGLMLIFSPGTIHGEPTKEDLYIQLANGQAVSMRFEVKDELVVMLGQGVHQYVNTYKDAYSFWAVPHRLAVESGSGERVWYGRMVLPPLDAVHPLEPSRKTFGEIRQELIARQEPQIMRSLVGCDSGLTPLAAVDTPLDGRYLQAEITEESCQPDTQFYCWHKCMNYTELVSPTACAEEATSDAPVEVACHNPDTNELWPGTHDPNFVLGCVDSALVDAFQQNSSNTTENTSDEPEVDKDEEIKDSNSTTTSGGSTTTSGGTGTSAGFVRDVHGMAKLTTISVVLFGFMFCL